MLHIRTYPILIQDIEDGEYFALIWSISNIGHTADFYVTFEALQKY